MEKIEEHLNRPANQREKLVCYSRKKIPVDSEKRMSDIDKTYWRNRSQLKAAMAISIV